MKTLTVRLKEAENRAENAEKSVKRLQKEVDRLEGIFLTACHALYVIFIIWCPNICHIFKRCFKYNCYTINHIFYNIFFINRNGGEPMLFQEEYTVESRKSTSNIFQSIYWPDFLVEYAKTFVIFMKNWSAICTCTNILQGFRFLMGASDCNLSLHKRCVPSTKRFVVETILLCEILKF